MPSRSPKSFHGDPTTIPAKRFASELSKAEASLSQPGRDLYNLYTLFCSMNEEFPAQGPLPVAARAYAPGRARIFASQTDKLPARCEIGIFS